MALPLPARSLAPEAATASGGCGAPKVRQVGCRARKWCANSNRSRAQRVRGGACLAREHVIDPSRVHHQWDASLEPTLAVESGDLVLFELAMAGRGQVELGGRYE